jgi:hypothetical protein
MRGSICKRLCIWQLKTISNRRCACKIGCKRESMENGLHPPSMHLLSCHRHTMCVACICSRVTGTRILFCTNHVGSKVLFVSPRYQHALAHHVNRHLHAKLHAARWLTVHLATMKTLLGHAFTSFVGWALVCGVLSWTFGLLAN